MHEVCWGIPCSFPTTFLIMFLSEVTEFIRDGESDAEGAMTSSVHDGNFIL